jgi:hypothetical protein
MSKLQGAKRAGITWLHKFHSHAEFENLKAAVKRLGLSLSQVLCGPSTSFTEKVPGVRKFTDKDLKASTLKIQITECDEFTRRCLERQAAFFGRSVEEYIAESFCAFLVTDEEESIFDPESGEVVLQGWELGHYIGCKVDKAAPEPPPSNFTRIPVPAGAIVETCV